MLGARASVRARAQLRRRTLDAILALGPLWVRRQAPGRLVNATGPGLDALDGYVTRAVPALVSASIVPAVVWVAIIWTDWQSGAILLVLLPLVPLFMALVGLTTKRLVARQYAVLERLSGQFLDLLRGLRTLRIYGRADAQQTTLRRITEKYRRQTMATLRIAFLSGLVLDLIAALSVAVVAVDIGLRLDGSQVSFTTGLIVLLLAPELFAPLRAVGAQHHATQEGGAAAAAALDIVDEAQAAEPEPAQPCVGPVGDIVLRDLTVRYPNRDLAAVRDVTLALPPGQVSVLTGRSGSGKSTLLAALLGFVRPQSGEICIETSKGVLALADIDTDSWRRTVAWLPQRPRPTQATVGGEVGLGDPQADAASVAAACRDCHAPLPSTSLAEDGLGVSAGQRRRIALARVLLRARAVRAAGGVALVLLDEPSEDLDRATEGVVARVIDDLRGWATVVIATHSAVLAALGDQQITFVAGQVANVRWQQPVAVPAPVLAPEADHQPAARTQIADPLPLRLRELVRRAGATRRLLAAVALSALAALTGLALTACSMWLISRAAQHPNVQALAIAVVGVRTFAIARALLRYAERLTAHDGALRMLARLRVEVFAALGSLSPAALGAYGRGDLLRRFVGDVDGAQEGLVRAAVPMSGAIAGALGSVVLAAALVPAAGGYLAVGLVLGGLLVPPLAYRLAGDGAMLVQLAGDRDRRLADVIDGVDELVAYGHAAATVDQVASADEGCCRASRRPAVAAALGTTASGLAAALTLSAVLWLAAGAAAAGPLSVVNVGVLAVCVLTGFEAVAALPSAFVAWARCRAGLRRVAEVSGRDAVPSAPVISAVVPAGPLGLTARALALAPALGAAPVLVDAELRVPAGRRVAIVGPSGCGKSTLLAAAMRMLPIDRGSLVLTGVQAAAELGDVSAAAVPAAIAGSLQGDHVFDATLRDNLRFVRPEASDHELDQLAERVGLLDTVRALPDGWSTPAGPDGAALSGGQRQRLLVARALLADPEILVLDEPTAHLDHETEKLVLADVLDATASHTVLLTTHRRLGAGQIDAVVQIANCRIVAMEQIETADQIETVGRSRDATHRTSAA